MMLTNNIESESNHVVYLLLCIARSGKKSIYVGYTTNFETRFEKHKQGMGAKYTRAHPPVTGAIVARFPTKSQALKYEMLLKKLSSAKKMSMLKEFEKSGEI